MTSINIHSLQISDLSARVVSARRELEAISNDRCILESVRASLLDAVEQLKKGSAEANESCSVDTGMSCFCSRLAWASDGVQRSFIHASPLNVRLTHTAHGVCKRIYLPIPLEHALEFFGASSSNRSVVADAFNMTLGNWTELKVEPWCNRGGFELPSAGEDGAELSLACELLACRACSKSILGPYFENFDRASGVQTYVSVTLADDDDSVPLARLLGEGVLKIRTPVLDQIRDGPLANAALPGAARVVDDVKGDFRISRLEQDWQTFTLQPLSRVDYVASEEPARGAPGRVERLRAVLPGCGVDLVFRYDRTRNLLCPLRVGGVTLGSHISADAAAFGSCFMIAVSSHASEHTIHHARLSEDAGLQAAVKRALGRGDQAGRDGAPAFPMGGAGVPPLENSGALHRALKEAAEELARAAKAAAEIASAMRSEISDTLSYLRQINEAANSAFKKMVTPPSAPPSASKRSAKRRAAEQSK
jgi:hypothetical protein